MSAFWAPAEFHEVEFEAPPPPGLNLYAMVGELVTARGGRDRGEARAVLGAGGLEERRLGLVFGAVLASLSDGQVLLSSSDGFIVLLRACKAKLDTC